MYGSSSDELVVVVVGCVAVIIKQSMHSKSLIYKRCVALREREREKERRREPGRSRKGPIRLLGVGRLDRAVVAFGCLMGSAMGE